MPTPRRETNLGAFIAPEPGVAVEVRAREGPQAHTVSDIVAAIQRALGVDPLRDFWVRGEISGFKAHTSGHWYFALKDDNALLNAVMFRLAAGRVRFRPQEGMEVLARARVDVYPARGAVQIIVEELRPVGAGELALRFEELRRRLEAEGLFAIARKRALPRFPRTVGIVTSLQAAALHDMVRVATERHPGIRIVIANARVQGDGAAESIASAIARVNARRDVDVLIVGRGGGSTEDLWAFNEEPVVRAVAASRIPVVSAVGHESDTTLCDHAADVRAATPSNACEIVVPDAEALHQQLDELEMRMTSALERLVPELRSKIEGLLERGGDAIRRTLAHERSRVGADAARLDALSPLAVLARGYSVVTKEGIALRRAADAQPGDDVSIRLPDGSLEAKITKRQGEADG